MINSKQIFEAGIYARMAAENAIVTFYVDESRCRYYHDQFVICLREAARLAGFDLVLLKSEDAA